MKEEIAHVYDFVDHMIAENKIDTLDIVVLTVYVDAFKTDSDVLVAWLTATLPVRSKLSYRKRLYRVTQRVLKRRQQWSANMLMGLA